MLLEKDRTKLLLFGEESERLSFRKLDNSDFDEWLPFFRESAAMKFMKLIDSDSPEEQCEAWFNRVFYRYRELKGGMNVLIEKSSGKMIGQCGLLTHDINGIEELEIGYSLLPDFRGKGFAAEAASKCKEIAFRKHFCDSIISIIHIENNASRKVALNNGMVWEQQLIYFEKPMNIFRIFNPYANKQTD